MELALFLVLLILIFEYSPKSDLEEIKKSIDKINNDLEQLKKK